MTTTPARSAEHTTDLDGPADRAYRLIADVTRWPLLFAPCLAATVLSGDATSERVRLWATAGDEVRSWISAREFDANRLRVDFRQEAPSPPVAAMSGHWRFEPGSPTLLVLGHEWASTSGTRAEDDLIGAVLDHNSAAEIGSVKAWADRAEAPDDLIFSFADEISIAGDPREVFDFLDRADLWPHRLPHVDGLDLVTADAEAAGARVQTLDMRTRAADGSAHSTRSVRLCFPHERIVYKQTTPPRGLLGHSGEWIVVPDGDGARVIARHHVALDPGAVADLLGPGVDLAGARRVVRERLSGNSLLTLSSARLFVEDRKVAR